MEFPDEVRTGLQAAGVSPTRTTDLCLSELFNQADVAAAAADRREDFLVHSALTIFPGAPRYTSLPKSIQRDLKTFFGGHAAALHLARELLFSIGKPSAALAAAETAVAAGLGAWRSEGTFRFHGPALNRLPAVLRVLVGCAGVLRGGAEGTDFIDIKLEGPRVAFIACVDAAARLPIVFERTRVDLGRLTATVDKPERLVVYQKGQFLPVDAPERPEQIAFDDRLLQSGAVSADGRGPRLSELREFLRRRRSEQGAEE